MKRLNHDHDHHHVFLSELGYASFWADSLNSNHAALSQVLAVHLVKIMTVCHKHDDTLHTPQDLRLFKHLVEVL